LKAGRWGTKSRDDRAQLPKVYVWRIDLKDGVRRTPKMKKAAWAEKAPKGGFERKVAVQEMRKDETWKP